MPSRLMLAAALFAGCATRLPEAELRRLLAPHRAGPVRLELEVEVDSATLAGTFDAILIARPWPPAVRLQLLPDLGAPILDVAATPQAVTGHLHGDAQVRAWRGADDDPPLSPLLLFGITLLEQHAPLDLTRVVEGLAGAPPRLHLRGCFPRVEVTDAEVVNGRVVARTLHYGYVSWQDRVSADGGSVTAPGFVLRARVRATEAADDLDDASFELRAP